jgi:hypothetical protein
MELVANNARGSGEVMVSFAPCKLTFNVEDALLPAMSVAWMVIEIEPCVITKEQVNAPAESIAGVPLHVMLDNPERESPASPLTGTFGEAATSPLAGEVMLSSGGVWSKLIVALALAEEPDASVAVPIMT